jgi:hypothetical protein
MSKVFYKLFIPVEVQYARNLCPRAEQSQENSKEKAQPDKHREVHYCFFSFDHDGTSTVVALATPVPRSGN